MIPEEYRLSSHELTRGDKAQIRWILQQLLEGSGCALATLLGRDRVEVATVKRDGGSGASDLSRLDKLYSPLCAKQFCIVVAGVPDLKRAGLPMHVASLKIEFLLMRRREARSVWPPEEAVRGWEEDAVRVL